MKAARDTSPVLVTGATGYIGSRLLRRLVADGLEVHAIVRDGSDTALIDDLRGRFQSHVDDLTAGGMAAITGKIRPGTVFHLASLFLSTHGPGDVDSLLESNIGFGTRLLDALARTGTCTFINTGTFWQHYDSEGYRPVNLYAATKQAFEGILGYYGDAFPLTAATLKIGDTYGPGDNRPKVMNLLLKLARTGEGAGMSPGEQLLDIVHVDDVVEGFLAAAAAARHIPPGQGPPSSWALSSGRPVSLRDLVVLFEKLSGKSLDITWGANPYRDREVMVPWAGGSPPPGWSPRTPLEAGLRALLEREGFLGP